MLIILNKLRTTDEIVVLDIEPLHLTESQRRYLPLKRLIDIIGASIALLLFSPIFIIVIIAIKLTSPGSVFFEQIRVGKNGRPFKMYKFRSMIKDADKLKDSLLHLNENNEQFFKIKEDPRVTRIGRFLRRSSIDELPQLLNVLLGHMSLVGPRPVLYREIELFTPQQLSNLGVKPGITCYWQTGGRSDSIESRTFLDAKYIAEFSLAVDILLLLKTPIVVLTGKGAY